MARSRSGKAIGKAISESDVAMNVASWVAELFLRALGSTWRVSVEGPDPFAAGPGPHLGAMWHRNVLIASFLFRDKGITAPISRSRDGELISRLLVRLGYREPPRGSSSRGGARALLSLVRIVEEGTTISIQTDGPRGPERVSKIGMVSLARQTGRPISPLTCSARPCMRFASWDGTLLPFPFARVVCSYGPAIHVARDLDPDGEELVREALDRELNRLTDEADERFGLEASNRSSA